MTREEWDKGIEDWQRSGGYETKKKAAPAAPKTDPPASDGGGLLGSITAGVKGAGREFAKQGGFAKDFAEGHDPQHPTAEWIGREATDLIPAALTDIVAPELAPFATASRTGRFGNALINTGVKSAVGGAGADPDNRTQGAEAGVATGLGTHAIGSALHSRVGRAGTYGAMGVAELARMSGALPHMAWISPWATAHGLSWLAELARLAGYGAPASTGAVGSQIYHRLQNGGQNQGQ